MRSTTVRLAPRHALVLKLWPYVGVVMLMLCAAGAMAQDRVRGSLEEAVALQSMATAARLCNLIGDGEFSQAAARMDRVHAAQLDRGERSAYLARRDSEPFRAAVQASGQRRARAGCDAALRAYWREVESTLAEADQVAGRILAHAVR